MNPNDALTHLEWLLGAIGSAVLMAFGAIFWTWDDSRKSVRDAKAVADKSIMEAKAEADKALSKIERDYKEADRRIDEDVEGIKRQATAFQASMFSRDDANKLEEKFFDRVDRVEDNLSKKLDELTGHVMRVTK